MFFFNSCIISLRLAYVDIFSNSLWMCCYYRNDNITEGAHWYTINISTRTIVSLYYSLYKGFIITAQTFFCFYFVLFLNAAWFVWWWRLALDRNCTICIKFPTLFIDLFRKVITFIVLVLPVYTCALLRPQTSSITNINFPSLSYKFRDDLLILITETCLRNAPCSVYTKKASYFPFPNLRDRFPES